MTSSSENVAKSASASSGRICRRSNRFVVKEGKWVNAATMVIQRLLLKNRLFLSYHICSTLVLRGGEKTFSWMEQRLGVMPQPGASVAQWRGYLAFHGPEVCHGKAPHVLPGLNQGAHIGCKLLSFFGC